MTFQWVFDKGSDLQCMLCCDVASLRSDPPITPSAFFGGLLGILFEFNWCSNRPALCPEDMLQLGTCGMHYLFAVSLKIVVGYFSYFFLELFDGIDMLGHFPCLRFN